MASGKRYDNEKLRTDANGLTFDDGYNGQYAYINIDRSPDVATTSFGACPAAAHKAVRHRSKKRRRRVHSRRTARRKAPRFTG